MVDRKPAKQVGFRSFEGTGRFVRESPWKYAEWPVLWCTTSARSRRRRRGPTGRGSREFADVPTRCDTTVSGVRFDAGVAVAARSPDSQVSEGSPLAMPGKRACGQKRTSEIRDHGLVTTAEPQVAKHIEPSGRARARPRCILLPSIQVSDELPHGCSGGGRSSGAPDRRRGAADRLRRACARSRRDTGGRATSRRSGTTRSLRPLPRTSATSSRPGLRSGRRRRSRRARPLEGLRRSGSRRSLGSGRPRRAALRSPSQGAPGKAIASRRVRCGASRGSARRRGGGASNPRANLRNDRTVVSARDWLAGARPPAVSRARHSTSAAPLSSSSVTTSRSPIAVVIWRRCARRVWGESLRASRKTSSARCQIAGVSAGSAAGRRPSVPVTDADNAVIRHLSGCCSRDLGTSGPVT